MEKFSLLKANNLLILLLSIIYLSYFYNYEDNNLEKIYKKRTKLTPVIIFCVSLYCFTKELEVIDTLKLLYFVELYYLTILTLEDEKECEISVVYVLILFINKLFICIIKKHLSISALILSSGIFSLIYLISKKSIGFGDILINLILSTDMVSMFEYYIFFTISFALGGVYSLIIILKKDYEKSLAIPFLKFIYLAYLITIVRRYYVF